MPASPVRKPRARKPRGAGNGAPSPDTEPFTTPIEDLGVTLEKIATLAALIAEGFTSDPEIVAACICDLVTIAQAQQQHAEVLEGVALAAVPATVGHA